MHRIKAVSYTHLDVYKRQNPNRDAPGTVIEAEIDKGRGPVATVLVQNGTKMCIRDRPSFAASSLTLFTNSLFSIPFEKSSSATFAA